MNSGTLNMLHNAGNQNIPAVTDCIHLNLFSHNIFVHQYRVILGNLVDDAHKLVDVMVIDADLHPLPSQHIGRPYQNRIPQLPCRPLGLVRRKHRMPCRPWNLALLQNLIKQFPVFCCIHIRCRCPQNRHPHLHQGFCQLDGCLPAKLHHSSIRLLNIHNTLHVLRCQRFKIQLVRNVKIRADRLRIVVDNNGLIALPGKCPGAVYAAEIEFDSLADTDRAGTKDQYFLFVLCPLGLILASIAGVIIGGLGLKLRRTGIHHLVSSLNPFFLPHFLNLVLRNPRQSGNHRIRKFKPLGLS